MDSVISARGLRRSYGKHLALAGIDLEIPRGRIVGLIGPNGAGKTTALKAILGLASFEGDLKVLGLDPFRQRTELMNRVCFIADTAVLPRWARVADLVEFTADVHPNFDAKRCWGYLKQTNVKPTSKVKELSKGMVVQVHLALILSITAELLVLDEPTLGLDILFRKRFYEQLISDYFDEQRTILITTHQIEEVEALLTDLLFIKEGRLVLNSSMDEVAERFSELEVAPAQLEAARALGPMAERRALNRHILTFDRVPKEQLQSLGQLRSLSVADLFVATMGGMSAFQEIA